MTSQPVPFKPHFGAFVLESLTFGMYGESKNAIREYIQNGFDSLQQAVVDGLIEEVDARIDVTLSPKKELIIKDYGLGLHTDNAVEVLASVGASNKDYRRNAGFRGIGRLAGIVFCDTLTFTTKMAGQDQKTVVVFDGAKLRQRLAPNADHADDAAKTLESCVSARLEPSDAVNDHFFEVRLSGFHNPPVECENIAALKSFLSQVSPLPYNPDFAFQIEIHNKAREYSAPIESIRVFVRENDEAFEELFKPYGKLFSVKREKIPLEKLDFLQSPNALWWGWIGRKRLSGAFKEPDVRGIRVRVRNIQIDDTKIIRDIFAVSHIGGKPRSSYARFAEWYVGEIFVHPKAAIPNARRDGFEEDKAWEILRNELDELVAEKYGKLAYKTSTADQLSIPSLSKRLDDFQKTAKPLIAQQRADWDRVSQSVAEATEIQRRISLAVKSAEDEELTPLRALSDTVLDLKKGLDALVLDVPQSVGCDEEIAAAKSELIQKVYRALKQRLGPAEWPRVRDIVRDATGEDPQ